MDADCKTDLLLTAGDPAVFECFDGDGVRVGDGGVGDGDIHPRHPRSLLSGGGDVVGDGGDGDTRRAPVIVCCDHAGLAVPMRLGDLGVAAAAFATHIAGDLGAREVSMHLARRLRAPLLLANYSRLVIDLNRHLDDATLIPTVSDGVDIPGNFNLTEAHRRQRIDELFTPYHACYRKLVDDLQSRFARGLIIAAHSFAPRMRGDATMRPWHFGVLWDDQREVAEALINNLRALDGDLCIGDNRPYHANAPRGYAMDAHAQSRGVNMALIEIRQDLIARAAGQRWAAEILHRAIAPLMDATPAAGRVALAAG